MHISWIQMLKSYAAVHYPAQGTTAADASSMPAVISAARCLPG
jgi:hypothetical protein